MWNNGFRFLESAGGAAILTVLCGTLGGTILNSCIQTGVRERERELAAYESHLEQERAVVEGVYALVGSTMTAAESIVALAGFRRADYVGVRRERFEAQEFDLRKAYTEARSRWRGNQYVLALQMAYYYPHDESMSDAWDLVAVGVDEFSKCAEEWLERSGNNVDTSEACLGEKGAVRARLAHLTKVLEEARVYPWGGVGMD